MPLGVSLNSYCHNKTAARTEQRFCYAKKGNGVKVKICHKVAPHIGFSRNTHIKSVSIHKQDLICSADMRS